MYGQLGFEKDSKKYKSLERTSNFHEFWREKLHNTKLPKINKNFGV
jgi:hypothetical protein